MPHCSVFIRSAREATTVLFENFNTAGGLFPNGFTGVLVTALAVFYAFSGSELIGVAAGETADPATSIPKAMRSTVVRLLIFFVGAIAVIAATVPFDEVGLDEGPFVTVFSSIGVPFAADIMNFVIIRRFVRRQQRPFLRPDALLPRR